MLDIAGSLQLLHAPHVRERDKALLRGIMVGGVWNGFLLGHARGEIVPCRFCGEADGDGHLFWECPHPPLVQICENPEFHDLIQMDKRTWPRCLLWHGWLPALDIRGNWATGPHTLASNVIENRLGGYIGDDLNGWAASEVWLAGVQDGAPCASPDVWTDGSLVRDKFSGVCCGGAGFFLFLQVLVGFIDLVGIWNCFRLISTLGLRGLCYFSRCLGLYKLSNVLSFGGYRCAAGI